MKFREIPFSKIAVIVSTVGFIAAGGIIAIMNENKVDSYTAEYNKNLKTLESLNAEIDATVETVSINEVRPKLNSAADAGKAVAKSQTEYKTVFGDLESSVFTDILSDINKYISDTDDCMPWFSVSKDTADYEWVFNTTYDFSGSSVPVLWTCYSDDVLMAYTLGVYDADSGSFSNIEPHITSEGDDCMSPSDDSEAEMSEFADDVNDILSQMDSMYATDSTEPDTENTLDESHQTG